MLREPGYVPAVGSLVRVRLNLFTYFNASVRISPDSFPYHRTTVTDTNFSDQEVEREIQAATNAFGALLPKLKMYNAAVLPSPIN